MRFSMALTTDLPHPRNIIAYRPDAQFGFANIPTTVIHGNYITANAWHQRGTPVYRDMQTYSDAAQNTKADMAVVCLPRSKVYGRTLVRSAVQTCGEWIAVDGAKTDGIDSFYKAIRAQTPIGGTLTKSHGRLFWFHKNHAQWIVDDWAAAGTVIDNFHIPAGVFSQTKIDPGSAALAKHLPDNLGDNVADFGAGWGYLSREILKRDVKTLSAIEVEWQGVLAIGKNISDPRINIIWGDATQCADHKISYDTVVMNPPFHQGRSTQTDLGQSFIKAAAQCLCRRGNLWLVANRHLPYEQTLYNYFKEVTLVCMLPHFKIFHAKSPRPHAP